jgi:hypothetical protein
MARRSTWIAMAAGAMAIPATVAFTPVQPPGSPPGQPPPAPPALPVVAMAPVAAAPAAAPALPPALPASAVHPWPYADVRTKLVLRSVADAAADQAWATLFLAHP